MVRYCQCITALTDAAPASSKPPYQTKTSTKKIHGQGIFEFDAVWEELTWNPGKSGMTIITLKHFLSLYALIIRRNNASNTRFRIISSPERPEMKNWF